MTHHIISILDSSIHCFCTISATLVDVYSASLTVMSCQSRPIHASLVLEATYTLTGLDSLTFLRWNSVQTIFLDTQGECLATATAVSCYGVQGL